MGGLGEMNLQVGADISGLTAGMAKADKAVTDFGNKAGAGFSKVNAAATKMGSTVTAGSNTAGQSLINLGRIAQDAPFGFIGIQNNINPLLESFQRLKVETGSTGAAFKSLAAGMVGGAGIGLAVSVVTGALTLLAQNGFFSSKKAANEAADAAKKYKDEVKGIGEAAAKEQAQILVLVTALKSETISRNEKLGAIKELQSINPKYFGDLKLENDLVTGLTSSYEKYKDSIIASIQNKIDSKKLEDVLEKINKATEDQQVNQRFAATNQERINDLVAKGGAQYANTLKVVQEVLTNTDKIKRLESERDDILKRIAARDFEGQVKFDPDKIIKTLDKAIKEAEAKGLPDIGIRNIVLPSSTEIAERLAKELEEANKKLGDKRIKPIRLPADLFDATKAIIAFEQQIYDMNLGIAQTLKDTFNASFASIGESIGQSLASGANIGQAIFGNLFKVLASGLKQIGQAMIALGTAKIALEKFKFAPGIGTLLAGIATVAIGSLLEAALPRFATGVTNFRGGVAMVGERGPELVHLPKGSNVTPNDKLGGMSSGGMQVFIPDVRLQGSDMIIAFNRQNKINSRVT